ncbi:hypothetical protein BDV96DRAFT_608133 [Lophiotrema nucula]|uniref:Uncharacterized protein n=1 Tax=Lophiotrema nucula TaxID=690887 RepID=A0A6A5YH82_9PLEO|nr:hypothetical protein BDV96DRAFT_608133 [Lophiotrema nucula]
MSYTLALGHSPLGFESLPEELLLEVAKKIVENQEHKSLRHSKPATSGIFRGLFPSRETALESEVQKTAIRNRKALKYRDLIVFCLLNKKCSRVGREILYADCDLTMNCKQQPIRFIRSLIHNEDLRKLVKSVKWESYGVFPTTPSTEYPGFYDIARDCFRHANTRVDVLPLHRFYLQETGQSNSPIVWLRTLLWLVPSLEQLVVQNPNLNGPRRYKAADVDDKLLAHELQVLSSHKMIQPLQHLTVCSNRLADILTNLLLERNSFSFPELKTLELKRPLKETWKIHSNICGWQSIETYSCTEYLTPESVQRILNVENVIIHGWMPVRTFKCLVTACTTIKSLTLIFDGYKATNDTTTGDIWTMVQLVRETIETLRLEFRRVRPSLTNEPVPYFIWPEGLHTCHKLKNFDINGGFMVWDPTDGGTLPSPILHEWFYPRRTQHYPTLSRPAYFERGYYPGNLIRIAEEFLPPNIETFRYTPDLMATKYITKTTLVPEEDHCGQLIRHRTYWSNWVNHCFRFFLANDGLRRRPSLKELTFSSAMLAEEFDFLQEQLMEKGVRLSRRSTQEEIVEMDYRYGEGGGNTMSWRQTRHAGLAPEYSPIRSASQPIGGVVACRGVSSLEEIL